MTSANRNSAHSDKALGTEALGIDLASSTTRVFAWVEQAFAAHRCWCYPRAEPRRRRSRRFGARFGKAAPGHSLINYRLIPASPMSPTCANVDDAGKTDCSGQSAPPPGTLTRPTRRIAAAGDPPRARSALAAAAARCSPTWSPLRALPQQMKDRLAGLTGLHGHTSGPAGGELYRNNEAAKTADKHYDEKPWPAITHHPVTDSRSSSSTDACARVCRHGKDSAWG